MEKRTDIIIDESYYHPPSQPSGCHRYFNDQAAYLKQRVITCLALDIDEKLEMRLRRMVIMKDPSFTRAWDFILGYYELVDEVVADRMKALNAEDRASFMEGIVMVGAIVIFDPSTFDLDEHIKKMALHPKYDHLVA